MSDPAMIKVVSVAPQLQHKRRIENHHGNHVDRHRDMRHGGSSFYGLTGRGVDDDNCDEDRSHPLRVATPSPVPSTTCKGNVHVHTTTCTYIRRVGGSLCRDDVDMQYINLLVKCIYSRRQKSSRFVSVARSCNSVNVFDSSKKMVIK